jgi:multiple sugar transport system substrate-binding protein
VGGFGFYFLADRATAYVKHPDDPAWLFDPETMTPRVNNPGWVQAIQDVMDLMAANAYPADQVNADPNTTAFSQFLGGTGSMITWWGDVGSNARTSDTSGWRCRGLLENPRRDPRLQPHSRRLGGDSEPSSEPRLSRLGHLRHQPRLGRRDEAQGGLVGGGASGRQGHLALDGGLSLGLPALPQLALQLRRVGSGGLRPGLRRGLPGLNQDSYNHPNAAIEPRIPGIFQYYSVAEDELVKGLDGQYGSAQETADAIAAAWERITDQIGRESQIALYKASLGLN